MQQPFGVKALAHASRRVSELPVPAPFRWHTGPQKAGKPRAPTMSNDQRMVDNCFGQDTYCEELTRIDVLGPNHRLIFTARDVIDPNYRIIVAKLIVPADFLATMAHMAARSLGQQPVSLELIALETHTAN